MSERKTIGMRVWSETYGETPPVPEIKQAPDHTLALMLVIGFSLSAAFSLSMALAFGWFR